MIVVKLYMHCIYSTHPLAMHSRGNLIELHGGSESRARNRIVHSMGNSLPHATA